MEISSGIVDKDVQWMFRPLNLMQYLMFCPKYRIKNDWITPNSMISNLISMLVTKLFLFMLLYSYIAVDRASFGLPAFIKFSTFNDLLLYGCGFFMNFVIGVIQTRKNIHFVLTFQKVHRFLNDGTNVNHFVIGNWISGIMTLGYYVIILTICFVKLGAPFSCIYVCYLLVFFDFNMVYATRIVKLLENQVCLWSDQVLNSRALEDTQRNCSKKVFQTYVDILECYNTYKACFQQFVSTADHNGGL